MNHLIVSNEILPHHPAAVRDILASSGFFYSDEIDVGVELAEDALAGGPASGYYFIFVTLGGRTVGFTCFGKIACTGASYDLYWIAVHNDLRGQGIGRLLLETAEEAIRKLGGKRVYIETSSRDIYAPTRGFYEKCGYVAEAVLQDFYYPGDGKYIYVRAF
jgi:GNAT superfamily N-acetyltransferase